MSLTLHHCHEARSMRVLWLLHELEIDFELKVYPFTGLHSDEYLRVHPLARVPALEHNGQVLYESGAIIQYLCELYSPDQLGRLPGHAERPAWLQWLHFAETIAVHGASLVQQHLVIYQDEMRSATVQKLERRRMEKGLAMLNQHLSGSEYLLTRFSAVDVAVGYSIYLARFFTDIKQFPELQRYYLSLASRPAFRTSLPKEGDSHIIFQQDFYTGPA